MLATSRPAAALPPSGEQIELRSGDQRVVVVEVGGGLRSYEADGKPVLDGYRADEMCSVGRGQVLMPWPNRLRDGSYQAAGERHQLALSEPAKGNAIHGLVRWAGFCATMRTETSVRMEHVLHPRAGYPFRLAIAIDYELGGDGLTVRTHAQNLGERPCPFGAGAHPYLTVGTDRIDECTLQAPGGRRMLMDERAIPTGAEPVDGGDFDFRAPRAIGAMRLDTAYTDLERDRDGLARVRLSAPDGASAELWQDERYAYLMLFSGDSIPDERRRRGGLGVEPMTCAPNAFQSGDGLLMLDPGEAFDGAWGITPRGAQRG